nr:hypothetical protein [Saprospiraceae bacterium]
VYVNSDGFHDTYEGKTRVKQLQCVLADKTQLWASGWRNSDTCKVKHTFESPEGFTAFLKKFLNAKI